MTKCKYDAHTVGGGVCFTLLHVADFIFCLCHSVSSCANGPDGKKVEEQVKRRNNIL